MIILKYMLMKNNQKIEGVNAFLVPTFWVISQLGS